MEGFRVITLSGVKLFHKLLFFFFYYRKSAIYLQEWGKGLMKKLKVITGTYL